MKTLFSCALLLATTSLATAQPYQYASANLFFGQGVTQQGHKGLINSAAFFATSPEADGNYHIFYSDVAQAQSDYSGVSSDQMRAACNKLGNDGCVYVNGMNGQLLPHWHIALIPQIIFPH